MIKFSKKYLHTLLYTILIIFATYLIINNQSKSQKYKDLKAESEKEITIRNQRIDSLNIIIVDNNLKMDSVHKQIDYLNDTIELLNYEKERIKIYYQKVYTNIDNFSDDDQLRYFTDNIDSVSIQNSY